MVQQLEELVQHDGDGGDAHAVLQGAGSAASRAASAGATLGVGGYSSGKRTGTRTGTISDAALSCAPHRVPDAR